MWDCVNCVVSHRRAPGARPHVLRLLPVRWLGGLCLLSAGGLRDKLLFQRPHVPVCREPLLLLEAISSPPPHPPTMPRARTSEPGGQSGSSHPKQSLQSKGKMNSMGQSGACGMERLCTFQWYVQWSEIQRPPSPHPFKEDQFHYIRLMVKGVRVGIHPQQTSLGYSHQCVRNTRTGLDMRFPRELTKNFNFLLTVAFWYKCIFL